jgi:aryl sulfotransferase
VTSWSAALSGTPTFLLLRYEDMLQQPERELAKIACLLNTRATPESLSAAIGRSSPERMRDLERSESRAWVLTKSTRQDIPFVRAPGSGGWKSVLPEESVAEIERVWGPLMKYLGYELTGGQTRGLERATLL